MRAGPGTGEGGPGDFAQERAVCPIPVGRYRHVPARTRARSRRLARFGLRGYRTGAMDEARTRRERIDPRLAAAGWTVRPWREVERLPAAALDRCAVTEYPTATGPADYALFAGGRLVAFIEAKRQVVAAAAVLAQAERYSRGVAEPLVSYATGGAPFLYATNGQQVYFEDARRAGYRSRELSGFHTPAALTELLARDPGAPAVWLAANPNTQPIAGGNIAI